MLIKTRKAKNSTRGLYLQDLKLNNTVFQPGTHFKYVVDVANKKILILPSEKDTDNTVSKRALKQVTKPVIDIRNKQALSAFQGCSYLQVSIFDDQVVIEGYVEDSLEKFKVDNQQVEKTAAKKIKDITSILKVRRTARIALSKQELTKAVGFSQPLSFESVDWLCQSSSVTSIHEKLNNVNIPLQVVSLFSNCGIMDLGFIEEGFEVVFALEINEDAVNTYRRNIGNHIVQADITKFDLKSIPKAPIMFSGCPCQGYSNSNRQTNYLENPNNLLLKNYIQAIQQNDNCKVFILENVPQILSMGNGRFKQEIYNELSDFEISSGVLNAADYGSVQKRSRAIFIGSKIGRIELPEPIYHPGEYKTVRQAFSGLTNIIPNQLDVSVPKDSTLKRMRFVPPGGNVFSIPEAIRPKGQHSDMYKRLEWDKPSITLVNPRKAMILHPEEDRMVSIRECARLQGLKDSFKFVGKLSSMQQMVANAVPLELTKAIAKKVRDFIQTFNNRQRFSFR